MTAKRASLPNKEYTVDVTGQLVECSYQQYTCRAVEPEFIVLEGQHVVEAALLSGTLTDERPSNLPYREAEPRRGLH